MGETQNNGITLGPASAMNASPPPSPNSPSAELQQHSPIPPVAESDGSPWAQPSMRPSLLKPKISAAASAVPAITIPTTKREWNTSKLGLRIGADALSAASAAILVAPIITMIDKGIIENASGRNTLGESLKKTALEMVRRPHMFMASRPFVLIFSLYFGTYFSANTTDTISSTLSSNSASSTTSGTSKFLATSSANLALCLYKDSQFTRLFSALGSTPRPVPLPTFLLFTARDALTIFASFNVPPLLAPKLQDAMSDSTKQYIGAASAAQFLAPAAVQLISTPLHLLGLDLYNRPEARVSGVDGRAARVLRDWTKSAAARICRIVPAFGVGGVVNMKTRKALMGGLETEKSAST